MQCGNVACWRPSAPTAPPFLVPPHTLKVEGKIGQLKLYEINWEFDRVCSDMSVEKLWDEVHGSC